MKKLLFTVSLVLVSLLVQAQAKQVSNLQLTNAIDNTPVSFNDYRNNKALVVLFTSNYCPYDKLYDERIMNLIKKYSGMGIAFVLINSNDPGQNSAESVEGMNKKANELALTVPYLADKQREAAKALGATKTPQVFILSPNAQGFTVIYSGAIDDNPQVPADVSQAYLQNALDNILANQNIKLNSSRPVGCAIR